MNAAKPIEIAHQFLAMGIGIIPITYRDKRPEVKSWKQYQESLPTNTELASWFGGGHLHNVGVICGWKGLTVLDFDDHDEFVKWMDWAGRAGGTAALVARRAYRVRSSRGVHVYIRLVMPDNGRSLGKVQVLGKMDVKGKGGYVLGPGSVHPSGAIYTPLRTAWVFPLVQALSDVLPTTMLVAHTEQPPNVKVPFSKPVVDDPWESAERPAGAPHKGLVDDIRTRFRLDDFFVDPEKTSADGRWMRTFCPFHDDRNTPSFWLDTQRQICGCFKQQCPAHHLPLDVINLFGWLHGLSNNEAIRQLARRL